ncbi:hypothetical protein [Mucilaginibacter aquariorum]|uniref:Uncharacterized protein n=1 Tax=Mucilaginibacter aquariorum TaxID=2967225 RepID=A0ABT1T465_9SPHI|nr:hypothetical protein [Mucilaginibacter aquariorum]MCQ6959210.1 hypothetical protein [Mucilaginibacter aquariorum]
MKIPTDSELETELQEMYMQATHELAALFNIIRTTKNELFNYTEPIMSPVRSPRA